MERHDLRLLLVTDIFPPIAAVGTQRLVGLCRHAAAQGWATTVLTLRPRRGAVIDETLAERIPGEVHVVRTWAPDLPSLAARLLGRGSANGGAPSGPTQRASGAGAVVSGAGPRAGAVKRLVRWLSWWMYVPDSRSAWLPTAVWAGLQEQRPSAIFSSAPMWTSHLAAGVLSRLLRVPWVADFRDPWCGSAWRELPEGIHQRVDAAMERRVVGEAARVTCAWDGIRRLLAERYPERAEGMSTILNGFEPEEIDPIEAERTDGSRCVLIHAGSLYGPRSPVSLLAGLKEFRREHPAEAALVKVVLVGGAMWSGRSVSALAEEQGVGDLVSVVPSTSHSRAVALVKGADAAILFGQSGSERLSPVPAKVYEYVGAGRPVLSIGSGAEAEEILRGGGCRVWTAADEASSCAAALREIVAARGRGELSLAAADERRMCFTRGAMAERLLAVVEDAMRAGY